MSVTANHTPGTINPPNEADRYAEAGGESIDFLGIALALAQRWRTIAIVTFAALLIGVAISLVLKPTFTSTAVILPPQQQQSMASAMMGQLGSLLGGGAGLSLKNPADMYVGFLESRTIADRIIAKFNLMSVYRTKRMEDTRTALAQHASFEAAKDGLIHVSVTDHSAQRASDIANTYLDELYAMNSTLAISEAAQRRVFFDRQLTEEKAALASAESDLKATEQRTGLIQLSGQAESIIRSIAAVEAQISSREVQVAAMRTFATDQNPEMTMVQQEIAGLRQQLAKLQDDQQHLAPGDTQVPAGRVPEEGLEYARKFREVKYHEALFDLLSRQYEAARIDEAKSAPIIQVVDRAVPPDKKSGPHGFLITLGFGFLGFIAACVWIFLGQAVLRMRNNPDSAEKLRQLSLLVGLGKQ